jgi:hypothetical protein
MEETLELLVGGQLMVGQRVTSHVPAQTAPEMHEMMRRKSESGRAIALDWRGATE